MFRKIRRFKQEMPAEECRELLKTQVRGVLSLLGDDGYPYAISLLIAPDASAVLAEDEDGKTGYVVTR